MEEVSEASSHETQKLVNLQELPEKTSEVAKGIELLLNDPRDVVLILIIGFLDSIGYTIFLSIIPIYLVDVWDTGDFRAGLVYGTVGVLSGVYSFVVGTYPRKIGYFRCLVLGALLVGLGYLGLAFALNYFMVMLLLYTLIPLGNALVAPLIIFSLKLYVHPDSRAISNTLVVLAYRVGIIIEGIVISIFWSTISDLEWTYTSIFICAASVYFLIAFVRLFLRQPKFEVEKEEGKSVEYSEIFEGKRIWRLIGVQFLLLVVYSSTLIFFLGFIPIYMTREFGEDTNWGFVVTVFACVSIVSLVGLSSFMFLQSAYSWITLGCFVMSASITLLVLPPAYGLCILAALVLAVGNTLEAPRVYDYILEVAPRGQEAFYLSTNSIHMTVSSLMSGIVGGLLIEEFCPEEGERNSWVMWLVLSCFGFLGAFVLFFGKSCLEEPDQSRRPLLSYKSN